MEIPFFRPPVGEEEIQAVSDVLRSFWLTTGPKTQEFESRFAAFLGDGVEAVAVNSATAGLHLALEACGIGPGDQVIVPTLTFTATAEVVRYLGAELIFVDVEPDTLLIDLEQAARHITPHCKAIMPVHFAGLPCDMSAVVDFARKHGLKVIEDAAHAFPAGRDGRLVGTSPSDACVFSFYANKTITTGEGGMLVTRNPRVAARARTMRTHGINRDAFDRFSRVGASWAYDVVAPGYKYNLTDIASAIGVVQLGKAYALQEGRQRAALRYLEKLRGLPLILPAHPPADTLHAWHLFVVRVTRDAPATRDDLIAALTAAKIGSSVHYRPLHQMTYWKSVCRQSPDNFRVADEYFEGALSLPLFPGMSDAEVDYVANVVRKALAS